MNSDNSTYCVLDEYRKQRHLRLPDSAYSDSQPDCGGNGQEPLIAYIDYDAYHNIVFAAFVSQKRQAPTTMRFQGGTFTVDSQLQTLVVKGEIYVPGFIYVECEQIMHLTVTRE